MRELAGLALAFLLLAGASVLAVESCGDRETFVSPPDAVAEMFVRYVSAKRWDPAREQLADPRSRTVEELEAMQRELGQGQNVEAETVVRNETRAVVTVRVPSRGWVRNFALVFDRRWKIE